MKYIPLDFKLRIIRFPIKVNHFNSPFFVLTNLFQPHFHEPLTRFQCSLDLSIWDFIKDVLN